MLFKGILMDCRRSAVPQPLLSLYLPRGEVQHVCGTQCRSASSSQDRKSVRKREAVLMHLDVSCEEEAKSQSHLHESLIFTLFFTHKLKEVAGG